MDKGDLGDKVVIFWSFSNFSPNGPPFPPPLSPKWGVTGLKTYVCSALMGPPFPRVKTCFFLEIGG